jgi:hypothetical protein
MTRDERVKTEPGSLRVRLWVLRVGLDQDAFFVFATGAGVSATDSAC